MLNCSMVTLSFESIYKNYNGVVTIKGAVNRPGRYQLKKNMTIKELIEQSDGLIGSSFLETSLLRKNSDLSESQITINLEKP